MASEVPRPVSNWTLVGHPWETCPETAPQAKDTNELADAVRRRPHKPQDINESLMQLGDVSGDGPTSQGHQRARCCTPGGMVRRRVRRRPHKPQDSNELADALQEEWRRIPQATSGPLTRSTRRLCLACLAANGGPTRYSDFCEIDILSRDSLQTVMLKRNALSMYRFNAMT